MDRDAFETDAWDSVNESLYTDQATNSDDVTLTIGETWQGALYGTEENTYGQRCVYLFETESDQREWFDAVSGY